MNKSYRNGQINTENLKQDRPRPMYNAFFAGRFGCSRGDQLLTVPY